MKGAHYQLLLVAALIGLISVVGGALVLLPEGNSEESWDEAIWWAFLRLSDPGYLGDDQGIWRRFVSTIITVLGYVVFLGSLVAIITTWLNRKIRNLEQGLTPVAANNHIIILGWNNRTIHIVGEIFQSEGRLKRFLRLHGTRRLKLIILSEDVTPDHLQELKDHPLIGDRATEIILRSGVAIDREHLERVDSLNAAAIIIPSQLHATKELITPDVETIKALLSLNSDPNGRPAEELPYVVAEIQDDNKVKAAFRAYQGPLEVIGSSTIVSRILAQNVRHPHLSDVYNELLSHSEENNNLFAREYPETENQSIAQVKSWFPKAIVLGVVREKDGIFNPMLNLPADFMVGENDRLILMARNPDDIKIKVVEHAAEPVIAKANVPAEEQSASTKVLILGWNSHIPALIKEFGTYEEESYQVTIVAIKPIAEREQELELITKLSDRVKVTNLKGDYVKEAELRRVEPAGFDSILLMSSGSLEEEEEADARTIVGYVLLEELLEKAERRPQVILELLDPSNRMLINRFESELIISPMILSHLLAATALRRELYSIYNELFTVGGAEIIFRELNDYGMERGSSTFREIENRAAEHGETALGVISEDVGLKLNPDRDENLSLGQGVRIVALTSVY